MNQDSKAPQFPLKFVALQDHLLRHYWKPDLQALRVVLSAVAAHPVIQGDPVWLFVQGPSGSGKTEIIINAIRNIIKPLEVMGTVNAQTLISFHQGKLGGILPLMKPDPTGSRNGLFVFKDLTTILSMPEEKRSEFIGQMREIYDGSWNRGCGAGSFTWNGKVTCIAACTPELEKAWALKRDLGERFLTVRWPRIGGADFARKAEEQRGKETVIRRTTSDLGQHFLESATFKSLPSLPAAISERVSNLSELLACLRAQVPRAPGGREILGEPCPEEPGRIHKSLSALVASHSALFSSGLVGQVDFEVGKRVALDSIPSGRLSVFRHFPPTGEEWLNPSTVASRARLSPSTIVYHCEEMVALGALEGREENEVKEFRLSGKFLELLKGAGLNL